MFAKAEFLEAFQYWKMCSHRLPLCHRLQGKAMDCAIAVDMANRMGLSPMMVMQNLYVVKGKPSWSGAGLHGYAQECKRIQEVNPVYFGEKGTEDRDAI